MSDSSSPTPIPSIKRVDSDISALRHEISQIREVLDRVSEIQLRSSEMSNRLLAALDQVVRERVEQSDQFVERDQFMDLVRKTAREEIKQAAPVPQPANQSQKLLGGTWDRRAMWLAIPLVLGLVVSAVAGYRLFNNSSDGVPAAPDKVSENQLPAPEAMPAEPQVAEDAAPSAVVEAAPTDVADSVAADTAESAASDEPAADLQTETAEMAEPAAREEPPIEAVADAPEPAQQAQDASTDSLARMTLVEEKMPQPTVPSVPDPVVESASDQTGDSGEFATLPPKQAPATTGMLIKMEPEANATASALESKPAPDLSALWEDESLTLGSIAASSTASSLAPAAGTIETPAPPEPKPTLAAEPAPAEAEAPAPAPAPAPSASKPAEQPQIATTTVTEQPSGPAIRPEIAMVLQRNLKRLGFYDGEVDGTVGPMTRRAMQDFQSTIGNPPTGVLTDDEMFRLAQDADKVAAQ